MGGTATIIKGKVADHLLQSTTEVELGGGRFMTEAPSKVFAHIPKEFKSFLYRAMPHPWQSTAWFFDYLSLPALSLFLRGERAARNEPVDWYIQLSFTGCAGVAGIAAELGNHWLGKWIESEGLKIQETLLAPYGFESDLSQVEAAAGVFIPFEGLGYGQRISDAEVDPDWEGSKYFEFDCVYDPDFIDAKIMKKLRLIDDNFRHLGAEGRCLY